MANILYSNNNFFTIKSGLKCNRPMCEKSAIIVLYIFQIMTLLISTYLFLHSVSLAILFIYWACFIDLLKGHLLKKSRLPVLNVNTCM